MHRTLLSLLLLSTASVQAVTIVVDYSYADSLNQLLPGSTGRAAIDQAAADLSAVLSNHHLAALPTRQVTGTASWNNGETDLVSTINVTASYTIRNPVTGDIARLANETFANDEFRIYVGMSSMSNAYAMGTAADVGIGWAGIGYVPSWEQAVRNVEANANAYFGRNGNLVSSTWTGTMPRGEIAGEYTVNSAPTAGAVSFSSFEFFHYDSSTTVHPDRYDLYSVALEQMLQSLGVDRSSDLERGERVGITSEDLMALQANGWQTTSIPEPGTAVLGAVASLLLLTRRRVD
jgi:hypothetical protein